jgi:competence protein ComEC
MAKNVAQEIITPLRADNLRVVFLYTGQGDSTIVAVPKNNVSAEYLYVLVDSDLDKEESEVNLISLLKDLLEEKPLDVFINTHPHHDHIGGIREIYDEIGIKEVWHSNHRPHGKAADAFKELEYVLKKVGKDNEFLLKGTNQKNKIRNNSDEEIQKLLGNIDYHIFSPAEYVCEDVEDDYNRIHEQCAVFKLIHKDLSILFTGDANKKAWEEHITNYHKNNLKADVMTASHHGARTAFKTDGDDESPYEDHLS